MKTDTPGLARFPLSIVSTASFGVSNLVPIQLDLVTEISRFFSFLVGSCQGIEVLFRSCFIFGYA